MIYVSKVFFWHKIIQISPETREKKGGILLTSFSISSGIFPPESPSEIPWELHRKKLRRVTPVNQSDRRKEMSEMLARGEPLEAVAWGVRRSRRQRELSRRRTGFENTRRRGGGQGSQGGCGRVRGGGGRRRVRGRSESEQAGDVEAVVREREGNGRRRAGGGRGLRRGRPPRDGEVDGGIVEVVLVRQGRARGQKLALRQRSWRVRLQWRRYSSVWGRRDLEAEAAARVWIFFSYSSLFKTIFERWTP
jgi:hypothetical protein